MEAKQRDLDALKSKTKEHLGALRDEKLALEEALKSKTAEADSLRAEIAQFVGWLHAQAPDQFRQVIESLPAEARAPFMQMPPFQQ